MDYKSDILDLQRKILDGVQLKDIDWADKLKGQERINFLKFCAQVVDNQYFEQIISMMYFPQIMAAANRAENYEIVSFHRATANGISLVKEFFQKYARQYEIELEGREEKFDKSKAFEPLKG